MTITRPPKESYDARQRSTSFIKNARITAHAFVLPQHHCEWRYNGTEEQRDA